MNGFDISEALSITKGSVEIDALYLGSELIWPKNFDEQYLTITSQVDNNRIYFYYYEPTTAGTQGALSIEVSTDKSTWTTYTSSEQGTLIATLNRGRKIYLRGNNATYYTDSTYDKYNYFGSSGSFMITGNIMSLVAGDNFIGVDYLTAPGTFYKLFASSLVTTARNLVLPATTLTNACYGNMFNGCRYLSSVPNLPATTLATNCYGSMFSGCQSITKAPSLPATTLAEGCYGGMFKNCTSLDTAPTLHATTLASDCYAIMFYGCSSLHFPPALPATNAPSYCYNGMFQYCTNLEYAPALPATTIGTRSYMSMFQGCTSLNALSSDLPALTLATECYRSMFAGCTSLEESPVLPARSLEYGCYNSMFDGCTSLSKITMLGVDNMYLPSGSHATPPLSLWVRNVAASGTFIKTPGAQLNIGTDGIPNGWLSNDAYSISITASNGTVTTNPASGLGGETIYITATPSTGYELESLTVTSGGSTITVTNNQFTMPEANVSINAVFSLPAYNINISQMTGGTVTPSSNTAREGDTVTLTVTTNSGYDLDTLTVMAGSTPITVTNNQFTMPGSDVTVSATFINYTLEYLTFTTPEGSTDSVGIYFLESSNNNDPRTISVSYDKVNWTSYTSSVAGTHIGTVQRGAYSQGVSIEKLYVKATQTAAYYKSGTSYSYFGTNPNSGAYDINYFIVNGNIMSLLYGDNFISQTSTQYNYMFANLFRNATYLKDATHLVLPATTLTQYCYFCMFYGCNMLGSNITGVVRGNVPKLLATTLATSCYQGMFANCTWLRTVPSNLLPATTLAASCYYDMFNGCTSLTAAPALPATTLAQDCYREMFQGCTALATAPALPATNLTGAYRCYRNMFYGCTSLTTASELPATTLAEYCYQSMFQGCTSLTTAPELPATTLTQYCYQSMFQGCTALVNTMTLPAATLKAYCYQNMFANCGSGLKLPDITAVTRSTGWGPCRQMFANSAITDARYNYKGNPFMPSNISSYSEGSTFEAAFSGCTSLLYAPDITCTYTFHGVYNIMFKGCTALTAAPQLAPTTLANYCYQGMFQGCTSLSNVTCLATNISGTDCTKDWLTNVSASGTFTKASSTTWSSGANGIPSGWTVVNV